MSVRRRALVARNTQRSLQSIRAHRGGDALDGQLSFTAASSCPLPPTRSQLHAVDSLPGAPRLTVTQRSDREQSDRSPRPGPARLSQRAFNTRLLGLLRLGQGSLGYANVSRRRACRPALAQDCGAVLGLNERRSGRDAGAQSTPIDARTTNPPSSCTIPGVGVSCATTTRRTSGRVYDASQHPTGRQDADRRLRRGRPHPGDHGSPPRGAVNDLPQVPVTIDQPSGRQQRHQRRATSGISTPQILDGHGRGVKRLYIYDATDPDRLQTSPRSSPTLRGQDVAKAGQRLLRRVRVPGLSRRLDARRPTRPSPRRPRRARRCSPRQATGRVLLGGHTNGVPAGCARRQLPGVLALRRAVGGTSLFTNADGSYDQEIGLDRRAVAAPASLRGRASVAGGVARAPSPGCKARV